MDNFSIHSNENPHTNPFKQVKFDFAHNIIHFKPARSLQHSALLRVAISIWQHSRNEMIYFFCRNENVRFSYKKPNDEDVLIRHCWPRIEQQVLKKVPQLNLPPSFKKELKQVIRILGKEILQFFEIEGKRELLTFSRRKIYLDNICWTFQGTIDKTKTALKLIKHPNLKPEEKFILACNCRLVDEIRTLVQLLPYDTQDSYKRDFGNSLQVYWFHHFCKDPPNFVNPHYRFWLPDWYHLGRVFDQTIADSNEAAVQYMWEKFIDKIKYIDGPLYYLRHSVWEKNCDSACFIMSKLSESEEAEYFNNDEFNIFEMLLRSYRWSCMFMPMVKYVCHTIWNFDNNRIEKLLSFCKEIEWKDCRYNNSYAELSEYCQSH